jgi:hypothetical protein
MLYVTEHNDPDADDLPRVFTAGEAAQVLRRLGLTGVTECALRTRAYRKQVPFHVNGRRITFTLSDLRDIAEGQACSPQPRTAAAKQPVASRPTVRRGPTHRGAAHRDGTGTDLWRAHARHSQRLPDGTCSRAATDASS